ncbi:hypothetical protein LINGRAHAP2_LOCUS24482 [Linum grandiflorum]
MEDDDMASPFWLQTADNHRLLRRRRNISSVFLNSGLLLTILLLLAFLFVFLVIPSFHSFSSQILRPHSVKKSWDSLNLLLVLFAIICGFLSRNGVQRTNSTDRSYQQSAAKVSSSPRRFYDYQHNQDRLSPFGSSDGLNRLRSFKSYPDLRQDSLWIGGGGDDRWRFYDDTNVRDYRFASSDEVRKEEAAEEKDKELDKLEDDAKDIGVDTFTAAVKDDEDKTEKLEAAQSDSLPSPPMDLPSPPVAAPSSPPLPKIGKKKRTARIRKGGRNIQHEEEKTVEEIKYVYLPPPSPPPPPPPPPPEKKKRSKDFLISLRRKKKKKQRQNSVENLASLFDPESEYPALSSIPPPSPLPPPPPPPPPPHFFQNLFSPKRGKTKKIHSVSVAPPPPPPPPRPSSTGSTEVYLSKSVRRPSGSRIQSERPLGSAYRPPKPVKTSSFGSVEDNAGSGNASPLIPIPPPPPPPPFKMPAWKFEVRGDYVRVASFDSSRSGSPDVDSEDPSDRESSPMAVAAGASPLFCPSPDVNTKADNFIARFKAGLKLEKVNSGKAKSNLGPSEGPI